MKVLYIGHYKEGTGWSQAAIDLIMSMHLAGIDVVCRNIKLTDYQPTLNPILLRLENKPLEDIDVCIQHVLPHHMVSTKKFKKNIAYFVGETNSILFTNWHVILKQMDEVWVPNKTLQAGLIKDGINTVKVIPHAFNLYRYGREHNKLNFQSNNNKFKFYYIGDLNDRKNIESIIRSFHAEFAPHEQVALVLKLKKFGSNENDLAKYVSNLCASIKKDLRLYKDVSDYHKEILITSEFNDSQIDSLHSSCDCFISPTHGEGWSIPAFDAMCFGKTPICSNEGGPKEFIDSNDKGTGYLVDGVYGVCNHSDPAFPELFTGREEWFIPSESEIKKAMRFYFENRDIDKSSGLKKAEQFSHESVGNLIKESLDDK